MQLFYGFVFDANNPAAQIGYCVNTSYPCRRVCQTTKWFKLIGLDVYKKEIQKQEVIQNLKPC